MTPEPATRLISLLLTILGSLMTAGIIACATMLFNMGNRLTAIESTMNVNKVERVAQFDDLRTRVNSLEETVYRGGRK